MKQPVLVIVVALMACGVTQVGSSARARTRAPIVSCPTSPANQVFTQALCLCGDYRAVGQGLVVQGDGATVGINGMLDVVGTHQMAGSVSAYGGISGVGDLWVDGGLSTHEALSTVGSVHVGGDLTAASVQSVGELEVLGTLRTPDAGDFVGRHDIASVGDYVPVAAPPCACGDDAVLDVAGAVAKARQTNDDAAVGLSTRLNSVGSFALTLGSGSYFLEEFSTVGSAQLTIDGAVALYVDGDLDTVGDTRFVLTPGSTLDLYVAGSVSLVGSGLFKNAAPGTVRLYVGGPNAAIDLVGSAELIGAIYAPQADLDLVGDTRLVGSLFARSIDGVGQLRLETAGQVVLGPNSDACQPTVDPGVN